MTKEIVIAGFGGQGILFTGKFLAYCGLNNDFEVSWLPSYGPEMRGGTANCSVCISDSPIGSPLVTAPELLMIMNFPSYNKFIDTVPSGGRVFIDNTLVDCVPTRTDIECFCVPASQKAFENGLEGMANMVLTGKLLKETNMFNDETIEIAMGKCVAKKNTNLIENNIKAIKIGMSL